MLPMLLQPLSGPGETILGLEIVPDGGLGELQLGMNRVEMRLDFRDQIDRGRLP